MLVGSSPIAVSTIPGRTMARFMRLRFRQGAGAGAGTGDGGPGTGGWSGAGGRAGADEEPAPPPPREEVAAGPPVHPVGVRPAHQSVVAAVAKNVVASFAA